MKKRVLWLAGLGLLAISALAASPHFANTSSSINNSGDLVVSWVEAGLGNGETISYTVSANASLTYACINGGKHNPQASQFQTVVGPVTGSATDTAGHNGRISDSVTITAPSASDTLSCPKGQRSVLTAVSYSGIVLEDTTNAIYAYPPDVSVSYYSF